jgi:sugar O-acyltransferase (sialic acid O-acetyltransferase NeuD family)
MDKKVILVGGFHEIIELCEEIGLDIIGIFDNYLTGKYLGYPILGTDENAEKIFKQYANIPLVITPDIPAVRENLFDLYAGIGYKFKTLISPYAKISKTAIIGEGAVIQHGVNVSSFVKIGAFVKLNIYSNVMHDAIVEDYTTIAPNAVILGKVHIKKGAYIGANSTVLLEKIIGSSSVIGAGAVVTKDVKDFITVKGIPAK